MMHFGSAPARLVAGLAMLAAAVTLPPAAAAQTSGQNVTVTMTDTGISPASVTIPAGGSVTFVNSGNVAHDAESTGGPAPFNTPGIGPGQSASQTFTMPGVYAYTSGTDCLHGVYIQTFTCGNYTIVVSGNPGAPAAVAPLPPSTVVSPAPTAKPVPAASTAPSGTADVAIADSGFTPASISIPLDGAVTWTNKGTEVHTATLIPQAINTGLQFFDTGGLGPGQSSTLSFSAPGTYVYYSTPDCFTKSNPAGFNCAAYYAVIVGTTPATPPLTAGPPPAVTVAGANVSVSVDDTNGFSPNSVTIKAGQTVGWENVGTISHSVVVNQNPNPGQAVPWWLPYQLPSNGGSLFDSGGIGPQQTFTYTFTTPGTYPYHSSTDPVYLTNYTNCSCTFTTYKFFGTVVVTS